MKHWTLLFSYWIYIYFILYYFKLVHYSPILLLLTTCITNIVTLCKHTYNIFDKKKYKLYILFLYLNIILHFLPFYYLYKTQKKINHYDTVKFSLIAYVVYTFCLKTINYSMSEVYNNLHNFFKIKDFIKLRFVNVFEFVLFMCITLYVNYLIIKGINEKNKKQYKKLYNDNTIL